jgi:hypothetical protein
LENPKLEIEYCDFANNDERAVTADWVVLCAFVDALAASGTVRILASAEKVGDTIATSMAA